MKLEVDIEKRLGSFHLKVRFTSTAAISAILGSSGCGKSMTLKCIAGIEKPDRGRIVLDGRVLFSSEDKIDLPPQERRVGYLFQSYALFPMMSVKKNILTGLKKVKEKDEKERRYKDVLSLLRIEELEELKPWQLSGGQQQRVALARIIVSDPDLLLLDEPFSALDTSLRETLQPELKALILSVGKQALLVTHSQSEASRLSSYIALMNKGEVLLEGKTEEVFASPLSREGAILTGYKNITTANWINEHTLYLPLWGFNLSFDKNINKDIKAIAFRSDAIKIGGKLKLEVLDRLEEAGNTILISRFDSMAPSLPPLWWRCRKEDLPKEDSISVSLDLSSVAFLIS